MIASVIQGPALRRTLLIAAALIPFGVAAFVVLRALVGPPDYREAAARGEAELQRGAPYRALRAVAEVRGPGPGAGEAMTVAGQAFIQLDKRNDARRALEKALEYRSDQPLALKLLAAICISSGETKQGLKYLADAGRLDPGDPKPWMAMGKVHISMVEYDRAISAFREGLRRDPDDRDARAALIDMLLEQNQDAAAEPWMAAALRDEPENPKILALAARQAFAAGRRQEAVSLSGRTLERDPDNVVALITRAKVALVEGRSESALADAERAAAIDPQDMAALHVLAQAEFHLGLTDRAKATTARRDRVLLRRESITKLAKVIAERPGDPALHCLMGQLAAEGGETVLAIQSYRAALALNPRYRPALQGLAALKAAPSKS